MVQRQPYQYKSDFLKTTINRGIILSSYVYYVHMFYMVYLDIKIYLQFSLVVLYTSTIKA